MPNKSPTRQERSAAALRANLKRRKAGQALAGPAPKPGQAAAPENSAGRPNNAKKRD